MELRPQVQSIYLVVLLMFAFSTTKAANGNVYSTINFKELSFSFSDLDLSLFLLLFICISAMKVVDAGGKSLSRGTYNGVAYAKFKAHKFFYLNITAIGSDIVTKGSECGLACVNIPSCFSFNLAAFFDINGKLLCELLPSDIYNNSKQFVASQFRNHYSITSPCSSWPCHNNGMCAAQYEKNSYVCVCAKGYTGKHCETDIDECASYPCLNNGTCTDLVNGFKCSCAPGFKGIQCETDVDECVEGSHACDVNATCKNAVGAYKCTCKPTYYGNGKHCKRVRLGSSIILGSLDYSKYLGKLISYLNPVLQNSDHNAFVRCWHANTDGWAATTFHSNCDFKGPTVTIIEVNSNVFGGYIDASWKNTPCSYYEATKAFLFSLYNINGYAPLKMTISDDRLSNAMYGCYRYGPTFGRGHDINISDDASNNNGSYTFCGSSYPAPPGYSRYNCAFFAGSYKFSPTDIEVFYETST